MRATSIPDAIARLQAIGKRDDRTPTLIDMVPAHMTYVRLFGSIRAAQAAAGFPPNPRGRPRKDADG